MSIDLNRLVEVDRFLADENKVLDGPQPGWVHQRGYGDYQLTRLILEETMGLIRSSLKFRIPEDDYHFPSLSLIFRNELVSRIDLVRDDVCESNPPAAMALGLPAKVCGTHVHTWADNRDHVSYAGKWELPVRRPVEDNMHRLEHMFFWFCDHINVRIQGEGSRIDLSPKGLFGGFDA